MVDLAAHLGVILPRHANLHLAERLARVLHELVVDVLVHEDAAAGAAYLALVEQDAQLDAVQHHVPLGVGEDDVGGLAAQLQRGRDKALGRCASDIAAHFGGTGEGQLADLRVVEDVLTRLRAAARDHVEHAGRDDALGELRQLEHRKRGRGRGLEHRAVAGGQHGGQLPSRHKEREVPRHDLTDDADGLVQHERHHVARKHVGLSRIGQQHAGEVTEMIDRVRHVDGARLANGLAVVQRLQQSELLGVLFDEVGHLVQDNSALGLRGLAPGFERLPSSVDRAVDVFLGGIGNNGKLFTVGGAVHVERAAVRRVDPFAADVELIGFLSRVVHGYFLSHECCMPLPAPAFAPSPNAHPAAGDASHARCAAPKAVAMKIHPCASNRRPRCQLFTRTVLFPRLVHHG